MKQSIPHKEADSGACFSLRGLGLARTNPRKLKHAPPHQFPDFRLFFSEADSSRALIQGVITSSEILEFGHSCERPVCPPSGFTQDHLAAPPDCISM